LNEWDAVPGLVEVRDEHRETTVVVDVDRLIDACTHLRDDAGFNFLSDITPVDYLGWGDAGVSGYIGTPGGRDLNAPMTRGYQVVPLPKPKRFAVNYHLLSISERPRRLRVQTWVDEGEAGADRDRSLADRRLARARGLGPDGDRDHRPPEPEADPPRRRLGRSPAS